ncbi:MAG: hypothetical protein V3W20_13325 [Candidatus Neomarinimicrobiota bacterium]
MVKYYGRARQRIGSVNTNQIGLNMSGCPSKVGRQGYLSRYIGRRAQCNQKFCGPVYYHGVIWSWNSGRCVAKAPRGQSFNSGVGHKSTPRFACGDTCEVGLDALTAVRILQEYLKAKFNGEGSLILVGTNETLQSDGIICNYCDKIQHYDPTHPEYYTLPPIVRDAADVLNALQIRAPLKPGAEPVLHVAGYESEVGQIALLNGGYGKRFAKFGPNDIKKGLMGVGDVVQIFGEDYGTAGWINRRLFRQILPQNKDKFKVLSFSKLANATTGTYYQYVEAPSSVESAADWVHISVFNGILPDRPEPWDYITIEEHEYLTGTEVPTNFEDVKKRVKGGGGDHMNFAKQIPGNKVNKVPQPKNYTCFTFPFSFCV